jgi:hypothetical protein
MRKVLFPICGLLLLAACEKEQVAPGGTEANQALDFRATKVMVCHNTGSDTNPWEILELSDMAWVNAHQDHGDAVDMDGDGYFDRENGCSETDCDDDDPGIGACSNITITWNGPRGICDTQVDMTEFIGVSSFIFLCQPVANLTTYFSLNTRQPNFELDCFGGYSPISGRVIVAQNGTVVEADLVDNGDGQGIFFTPFNIADGPITATLISWKVGDDFICDPF